jgi:hypothetical protein
MRRIYEFRLSKATGYLKIGVADKTRRASIFDGEFLLGLPKSIEELFWEEEKPPFYFVIELHSITIKLWRVLTSK